MFKISYANWAGNVEFNAAQVLQPTTIGEIQGIVREAKKLRTIGKGHSFNRIADCADALLSLEQFNQVIQIDTRRRTVTVQGGTTYDELCRYLHLRGWALANLASLTQITVAGACATATHGSGMVNGNLATAISAIQFVAADGELHSLSRTYDGDRFAGAIVSLGALGVVTEITLDIVPAFEMRQEMFLHLPWNSVRTSFDEIMSSAYSVSLMTNWCNDEIGEVWLKRRVSDGLVDLGDHFYAATRAPLDNAYAKRMNGIGPWYDRLTHFSIDDFPGESRQLQTEYFVPHRFAVDALTALNAMRDRLVSLAHVSEVRAIAVDHFWLSPCYRQSCVGIHFTWKYDLDAVLALLPQIEACLRPYQVRPHWAKLFTLPSDYIASLYPRLPDFRRLMQLYDPTGKFRNNFIRQVLGD